MKNLLTSELLSRFAELGPQDEPNPLIVTKFFTPWSRWTWFAFSYNPENGIFFGLIKGTETELGYFAMEDLRELRGPIGLRVERDLYWREKRLSDQKKELLIEK